MRTFRNGYLAPIACASMMLTMASSAAEDGALGVKVGPGSRLLLSLDAGAVYYSNYYYQPSSEDSAFGIIVKPLAELNVDSGSLRYSLGAGAEAAGLDLDGDADDYVDTVLQGQMEWNPLTRHRFSGEVVRRDDHDAFGTRRTESTPALTTDLDEWTKTGGKLVYRFGAPQATINLEAEVSTSDTEYTTNRSTTRFLDHDSDSLRGTVFYNVSSKTALLAEVVSTDINYDNVAPGFASRAGEVTRYRVGGRWLATGNTSGDVRIGKVERSFDSGVQDDYDELDWQIGITWSPRARDVIRFTGGREPEESYLNASSVIDDQFFTVAWTHDWTGLLKSKLRYAYHDLDFRGISRQDDLSQLSFGLDYQAARRWSVYGELSLNERDSTVPAREYDGTVLTTGIRLTY